LSPAFPRLAPWLVRVGRTPFPRVLRLAYDRWSEEDGDQRAAAVSFYLLLSMLPLVLLLVSAGSLFFEQGAVIDAVFTLLDQYTLLTEDQEEAAIFAIIGVLQVRGATNVAAFGFLIWGSLRFLHALIRSTNRVWDFTNDSWWRLPDKSLALLSIAASAVLFGVLLPFAASMVRERLTRYLAVPDWAFALLFRLIPWLVLYYGFIMMYKLAPSKPTRFADLWFGALVATSLIWVCGRLFLLYLDHFANFNVLYGTLGGAMAFLLWLYLSSCICVFGVCLCSAHATLRQQTATDE
jgi:Ca2+-transporting ATPase